MLKETRFYIKLSLSRRVLIETNVGNTVSESCSFFRKLQNFQYFEILRNKTKFMHSITRINRLTL